MSARLLPAALLALALGATAAQRDTSVLTVNIRPAVAMTTDGASVAIKIRLAPESTARVWRGEECATIPASGYAITYSGTFSVPIESIGGRGSRVCLSSTDGMLASSVLLLQGVR